MTCPTIDKLSQYVDDLLTGEELVDVRRHLESCGECQHIVEVFKGEKQFIKDTLKQPILPDDFTNLVLDQLEPYERKEKRRNLWKRIMLAVAGMTLAIGLSAAFNPSFAAWVGGLFTTEQVDEGLRIAADAGITERVNLEVTDKGLTLKVEDVVADSSRVVLSYQILNGKGKAQKNYHDLGDLGTAIFVTDQNGTVLADIGMSWGSLDDYGLFEFSLRDQEVVEKITVHFNIEEINGVKGSWKLDVPVELEENNKLTTTFSLDGAETSAHGVNINLKEVKFAPSSSEIFYETSFTDEVQAEIESGILLLEKKYGKEVVHQFSSYGNEIQYHIENEKNEAIFRNWTPFDSEDESGYSSLLQGTGWLVGRMGHEMSNDSFIPSKEDEQLTFVLDGVLKTVPADLSIEIKRKELKKRPVPFEYEGNFGEITKIEKQVDYFLQKSLLPIGKRTFFTIKMEGEKEMLAPELGTWVLVDDKGDSHIVFNSGSILDQTLTVYGLDKIPEAFTLHLLSMTTYEEVKEKWEVPLH